MLTGLVESVNERLRERQSRELRRSIDSIDAELAKSTSVEARKAISNVPATRHSEASFVGTREDFALKFVARPAIPPRYEFASPRPADIEPCACVRVASWSAVLERLTSTESENDRRQL